MDIEVLMRQNNTGVCLHHHRWFICHFGTPGLWTRCRPSWRRPFNIEAFASLAHSAVSEWMLLYCLEWACIPVGKMTIPDCGPAVRSIQMKIAAEKKKALVSLSSQASAKHFNGDQWKGRDRRSRGWLAGRPGAHTAAALHTACTAVYSQHKLLRPAWAFCTSWCVYLGSVCVCAVGIYAPVTCAHDASVCV